MLLSLSIYCSFTRIVTLPINVEYLQDVFLNFQGILMLLKAYTFFMVPFILIGFLVVYLFATNKKETSILYFFDLIGASFAALIFAFSINHYGVTHSLYTLAILSLFISLGLLFEKHHKILIALCVLFLLINFQFVKEINNYAIDKSKGWEWIPGYYPGQYEKVASKWHPLGRTEIFKITGEKAREDILSHSSGTFEINIKPYPEFCYLSTNYLAGTPAYNYAALKDPNSSYKMNLFSQPMESPYVLMEEHPKVLVIGAGGGRDIFMAKSHGATKVLGAEVNSAIVNAMSNGGILYNYTDHVYDRDGVKVYHCDGRYLVKTQEPSSFNLIILNGVDTYNGLSSGSYAYAESYLYTKDAIKDYLKILDDDGVINFNRWLFADMPRETLKLMATTLEALRDMGAKEPWKHIFIATNRTGWSITLIKKTAFTEKQIEDVRNYFDTHNSISFYPLKKDSKINAIPLSAFNKYVEAYILGEKYAFEKNYPFDISVITDDIPFFYKYYKVNAFNPFRKDLPFYYTGNIIFTTQFLSLLQAILFIMLFIFGPLILLKKDAFFQLTKKELIPFFSYFSALGAGFMFIEIPLMQRLVLLLGDPIYAISVVLAVILSSAGVGSLSLPSLKKFFKEDKKILIFSTFFLFTYIYLFILLSMPINALLIKNSYVIRVLATIIMIFPIGYCLGLYFPTGLNLIEKKHSFLIPWAWALNCGLSVLGSLLAIILAQFEGFNAILQLAIAVYFVALLSYLKLDKNFN